MGASKTPNLQQLYPLPLVDNEWKIPPIRNKEEAIALLNELLNTHA